MPIVFDEKFKLDTQGIGLQFIALIIGSLLRERLPGPLSHRFLRRRESNLASHDEQGRHVDPRYRLWLSYINCVAVIVGLLDWAIRIRQATEGAWSVTPLIGGAMARFGDPIITTTPITFRSRLSLRTLR